MKTDLNPCPLCKQPPQMTRGVLSGNIRIRCKANGEAKHVLSVTAPTIADAALTWNAITKRPQ